MTARLRFRDVLERIVPWWLSNRPGKDVGYRFLWGPVAVLDVLQESLLQGMQASWPGAGTPTALGYIGRSRGVIRGLSDTDEEYEARLRGWLDRAELLGSMEGLALELHEYLLGRPRVRVVNRAGRWVTVDTDGTVTRATAAWDWDSVTNPERAGFWSEEWVIIYPTTYAKSGTWGDGRKYGARDSGLGHVVTRHEREVVRGIISDSKGGHSKVRSVLWTSDAALFDPANPASLPDGTWGEWSMLVGTSRVASGRNTTTCRYWEP
jgi:hypothetical protein